MLSVGLLIRGAIVEARPPCPLRLGIAGLSHSHVHGILRRAGTDVRIVGIAEPNRELAVRYARRYGLDEALLFGSLEEMLARAGPEAVAAFGSTDEHRAVVEACAPRGIHVMVEKPLAFDSREALAMRSLAESHHVHLLTNLETTWYPSVHAVGTLVESGAVGEIRKVVVHDGHRGPKEIGVDPEFLAWLTDPVRNGGGALTDFGCYGANLMTWLMKGEAPLTVTAVTQRIKPAIYPRVDDEATIVLTYPRAQAILQASWNWPASRKDMEVYGERGYALAPDRGTIRVRRDEKAPEEASPASALAPPLDDPFAYLAAIVRGRVLVAPADLSALGNNVTVARILDAARESARTGRTVRLVPVVAANPLDEAGADPEREAVEKAIHDSIDWALTKDRALLERVIAHDANLFIFHPDSKSTIVGWDAIVKHFGFWMDPRFKATRYEVNDLRTTLSRSGDVAWFSAILDDCGEWDGKPSGWNDTRWTGVLEKRDGAWVIVQMHFSFASDRAAATGTRP